MTPGMEWADCLPGPTAPLSGRAVASSAPPTPAAAGCCCERASGARQQARKQPDSRRHQVVGTSGPMAICVTY